MTNSITDLVLGKAKKLLEVGSEAADVLVHLQGGMSPIGLTAVALRVVNSVREHRAISPEEHFAKGWMPLDVGPLINQALVASRLDAEAKVTEVQGMHQGSPAITVQLGECTFGWAIDGNVENPKAQAYGCWIPSDADLDTYLARLGRSIWTQVGSLEGFVKVTEDSISLVSELPGEALPSGRADELFERLEKFLSIGTHRSVFVVGAPGTGKSSMLRYIANKKGGLRLRMRFAKMDGMRPEHLVRVAQILRPDVLLIDDLDRYVMGDTGGNWGKNQRESGKLVENSTPEAAEMLDPLESFANLIPLVMASANFSTTITEAILRPGRFDEMEIVDKLDDDVYRNLLPDVPDKLVNQLISSKVPIVYVNEIRKRVDSLGYEDAAKEVKDLIARADKILRLAKRKAKPTNSWSLAGKSPLQRAAILDRRAAGKDKTIAQMKAQISKIEVSAEAFRVKAEAERKKAAAKKEDPKSKSKSKPKTTPKSKKKMTIHNV